MSIVEIICLTIPAICTIIALFMGQKYESMPISFFGLFVVVSVVIFMRHLIINVH